MKIVDNSNSPVYFMNIDIARVFKYMNDSYYIRTELTDILNEDGSKDRFNAVNLVNGKTAFFEGTSYVIPLNCEMVVTYKDLFK